MPPLLIRPIALHEVPSVAALRPEHDEGGASAERMTRYLLGEHHPQMALAPRGMWAADLDGTLVAFIRRLATWFADHGARRVCVNASDVTARAFYGRHGATPRDAHWMVWANMHRSVRDDAGT